MAERKGMVIVAASGYFDPLHVGHVDYLERAKSLGDYLVVIVNTDEQARAKKGYVFIDCKERQKIIGALTCVNEVVECIDWDGSVCRTLEMVRPDIFAKGGDRNKGNIPEAKVCEEQGIRIVDGLGAKIQSSSLILEKRLDELSRRKV